MTGSAIAAERRQLVGLNDDMLRDLGLSRGDVEREYARPFWSAVNYDALETTRRNSGPRLGINEAETIDR